MLQLLFLKFYIHNCKMKIQSKYIFFTIRDQNIYYKFMRSIHSEMNTRTKGIEYWDVMPYSLVEADISVEHTAFCKLATCFQLVLCLAYSLTLKMEAVCSSETSVNF
jgi:hypothetical protein